MYLVCINNIYNFRKSIQGLNLNLTEFLSSRWRPTATRRGFHIEPLPERAFQRYTVMSFRQKHWESRVSLFIRLGTGDIPVYSTCSLTPLTALKITMLECLCHWTTIAFKKVHQERLEQYNGLGIYKLVPLQNKFII